MRKVCPWALWTATETPGLRLDGELFLLDGMPFTRATIMLRCDAKKQRLKEESVGVVFGADEPVVYSGPEQVGRPVGWLNTEGYTGEHAREHHDEVDAPHRPQYSEMPSGTASSVRKTRTLNRRATDNSSWLPHLV